MLTINQMIADPKGYCTCEALIQSAEAKVAKNGNPYLDVNLVDTTGNINAKFWNNDEPPVIGSVMTITGTLSEFAGKAQLNIESWTESLSKPADFVSSSYRPAKELWGEVCTLVAEHCTEGVAQLVGWVTYSIQSRLMESPAASSNHHARLGGLVEHIHSMAYLAMDVVTHYERRGYTCVDRGLLLAGVILHDVGKVHELSGAIATTYTTKGQLLGHIAMGSLMVSNALDNCSPKPSEDELCRIWHMILSHHGKLEWGSPVLPCTPEAIVLHQLDMIDSRFDALAQAASNAGPSGWSPGDYKRKPVYIGSNQ